MLLDAFYLFSFEIRCGGKESQFDFVKLFKDNFRCEAVLVIKDLNIKFGSIRPEKVQKPVPCQTV